MLRCSLLAAGISLAIAFDAAAAVPDVVVSIKPLHSLAARVMAGVGEPTLLVAGGASLHSFSLKPSQAAALEAAELVVWVGPNLETFLHDPLDSLAGKATVIEAMALPGMKLLPTRSGGTWEPHRQDEEAAGEEEHDHEEGGIDGHLFLDIGNAVVLTDAIAASLRQLDPDHADQYAANAAALRADLQALDGELRDQLAPIADRPFVVFHDAYQYFEARYALSAVGSITVSPEQSPGARRLSEIRDKIETLHALCVFTEPGFEPRLLETVVAGGGVRSAALDPEGIALTPGPELYLELLRGLAQSVSDCLSSPG